ncbi:hypothetical protein [Aeromicrobium phragmitis]|nr:hypothetical protein [Aeromicrobium phragmitis]
MTAERIVRDALPLCSLRSRGLGGIPVEFEGGMIDPPDERRSYS